MPTSPVDVKPSESAPATVTAVAKYACAACGAQAEWNPSERALVCPYCGTESPAELDAATGGIHEIDLVQALRELPDELRGWQVETRSVQCRSCRAVSVFDPERVGGRCEFCGSPELVDYEEIKAPIRPQSLLPFRVAQSDVREQIRSWYAKKWFAPSAFKKKAAVDTGHGAYLPYWTFDAQVFCNWSAEAGFYHYTTESSRDSSGRSRTRKVRHIRWRSMRGSVEHFFDDEPVPGTQGVDRALLAKIEPFPTQELVPYDTGYLSGFIVEHYRVVLVDAAQQARSSMETQLQQLCAREIPGETYRNLRIDPDFSEQSFKHVLVPVWMLTYVYRRKPYRLLVNGYTGKMAGRYPKSAWKIFFAVSFAAAALSLAALLVR